MDVIGYLGPEGTFTEEAAHRLSRKLIPFDSIIDVLDAVKEGKVDKGVVPIENSIEGPVGVTLDLLAHEYDLCIEREIILKVDHYLLANRGVKLRELTDVYSHPQSLAQCHKFIEKMNLKTHSTSSTAAAAKIIKGKRRSCAIGTLRAARLYDLEILAEAIQDYTPNMTRFIAIALHDHEFTGFDKTSILFTLAEDKPGGLYEILGLFAEADVNLTKIESRPSKMGLGRYIFFIDFEGHRKEKNISIILEEIRDRTPFMKILGSYPMDEWYKKEDK
ncbi:MAG: prephenate dehydratase [Methanobacteriaceae archaeon]|nr:prephenate dehydratase [Methanobacteriaceae archaeon]